MKHLIDKIKSLELNYVNEGIFHNSLPKDVYVLYQDDSLHIDIVFNYGEFVIDIIENDKQLKPSTKEYEELYKYFKDALDKEVEIVKEWHYSERYEQYN